ncbi:MAG: methyltransferase [Lachnospiraceae bacterium]|nr:methyltransferase [Lachnospiraceae bacterium]RKI81840.1 hypothetical protein D7V90_12410 [bacterium 1xD42-87]
MQGICVLRSDGFSHVTERDFDLILSNPPIMRILACRKSS